MKPATYKQLLRHAQLYGTELVIETAVQEAFLQRDDLIQLQHQLWRLDDEAAEKKRYGRAKKRRKSAEDVVDALLDAPQLV